MCFWFRSFETSASFMRLNQLIPSVMWRNGISSQTGKFAIVLLVLAGRMEHQAQQFTIRQYWNAPICSWFNSSLHVPWFSPRKNVNTKMRRKCRANTGQCWHENNIHKTLAISFGCFIFKVGPFVLRFVDFFGKIAILQITLVFLRSHWFHRNQQCFSFAQKHNSVSNLIISSDAFQPRNQIAKGNLVN